MVLSFFLISVVGGLTSGAVAPGKPPQGTTKTCYAHGEETRAEPGPTAAGAAHAATISGHALTTGSASSSPGRHTRRSRTPRPRWTAHRQPPRGTRPPSPPAQRTAQRPTRAQAAPAAHHSPGTDRERHSARTPAPAITGPLDRQLTVTPHAIVNIYIYSHSYNNYRKAR